MLRLCVHVMLTPGLLKPSVLLFTWLVFSLMYALHAVCVRPSVCRSVCVSVHVCSQALFDSVQTFRS